MYPIPPFEAETFKVFWVSCPPTPQEGRGLWPLPPTTQLILPTTKKNFLYAGTVMEVSGVQIL